MKNTFLLPILYKPYVIEINNPIDKIEIMKLVKYEYLEVSYASPIAIKDLIPDNKYAMATTPRGIKNNRWLNLIFNILRIINASRPPNAINENISMT